MGAGDGRPRACPPVELTRRRARRDDRAARDPERRNVLDEEMAAALREAAERSAADADGPLRDRSPAADDVFAAGADIERDRRAQRRGEPRLQPRAARRRRRRRRAADADDRRASTATRSAAASSWRWPARCASPPPSAKLGLPEARLGIIPATGGLARLPRLVPPRAAARLLLTGELVNGEEAERARAGRPRGPARAGADGGARPRLAERIAAAAPLSTRAIVDALRRDAQLDRSPTANERTEERLARRCSTRADRREGASAFLERREPRLQRELRWAAAALSRPRPHRRAAAAAPHRPRVRPDARSHPAPHELDASQSFPAESWAEAAELGLLGASVPSASRRRRARAHRALPDRRRAGRGLRLDRGDDPAPGRHGGRPDRPPRQRRAEGALAAGPDRRLARSAAWR